MPKMITLLTLLFGGLVLQASAQSPAAQRPLAANAAPLNVVLADGTPVRLTLGNAAAAKGVRMGENLELEVAEDVRVNEVVVIAKGSIANAEATNLRSGLNGHGGWIDINLDSVTLADGQRVPIRSTKNKPFRDQGTIVSNSGQDASIAQGTDVTAYISGDQSLDLTRLRAASGPTVEVKVSSNPSNAEITLDGRLAGSTPYTLRMSSGDHVMVLRIVGFRPWQGKVHVAGEPLSVDVPLVKLDGTEPMPTSKPPQPSLGDLARAARARKPQSTNPPSETTTQTGAQTGKRDPMEELPKQ